MGTPALFDINIFEDVARARQGWESSLNALALVEEGEVDGYVSKLCQMELIRARRVPVGEMITHRLSLAETGLGFRLVAEAGESIKVIVEPQR